MYTANVLNASEKEGYTIASPWYLPQSYNTHDRCQCYSILHGMIMFIRPASLTQ